MGGVQSGPHSLGEVTLAHDALSESERQRQKHSRGGGRYENFGRSDASTRDKKQLLKRTKSLAVISEENRNSRDACYFRLGEPSDIYRRQRLIPRAKLINRHSLKDRLSKSQHHLCGSYEDSAPKLYHSQLIPDTYSAPDPPVSLPNLTPHPRGGRNPDRLNILNWPEPPKRYQSVQALDTVTGLVDVVEEDWSKEENRSIDCIYTQAKRKRKEHRSLDSVLFEDEGELEYFDVLNLLPLSNVRLEFENSITGNNNLVRETDNKTQAKKKIYKQPASTSNVYEDINQVEVRANDSDEVHSAHNATDEEKYKNHNSGNQESDVVEALNRSKIKYLNKSPTTVVSVTTKKSAESIRSPDHESPESEIVAITKKKAEPVISEHYCIPEAKKHYLVLETDEDKYRADLIVVTPVEEIRSIEEAEDYKSIWISDSEEPEEMSRRPQVLKTVDNDVTRRNRHSMIEFENVPEERMILPTELGIESEQPSTMNSEDVCTSERTDEASREEIDMGAARSFFETKCKENTDPKSKPSEGKFERIIKETTSMFGKACNAVKGSLGFEARSESSDLGLGSETGSDTRRQSVDDSGDPVEEAPQEGTDVPAKDNESGHTVLTRSRSCVDPVKNQDGPEFDHIRYKIMKSDMFSKNMYGSMKTDVAFDGLMQYLREYSFQDLLVDNNVVIIEPVRAEPVERKPSPMLGKNKGPPSCRIAGAIQKKSQKAAENERNCENQPGSPKQTSLRRHFFYHPIRVNRELIDNELPDPDTVRNVRKMFETTLKMRTPDPVFSRNCETRKSVSMKDLSGIDERSDFSEKTDESRSSSRAKDLTRLFENLDKVSLNSKDEPESPRSESKTRIIARSFEARSGQTSPSESAVSKNKVARYLHNWDAGSVSSGVSSDYPDTDPGSGVQCTSSEDEDDCQYDDVTDHGSGHSVSQDVLKKIRECGTSVTYYGGKVVNTCNSPLISPMSGKIMKELLRNNPNGHDGSKDYVKFRLVKSNSCDSRLELTGRLVNETRQDKHSKKSRDSGKQHAENLNQNTSYGTKSSDLWRCPIMETPSIEVTSFDDITNPEIVKEPPIVIGLEPKKEEVKEPEVFRADFKLGKLEDTKCNVFNNSALNQWQMNENIGEKKGNFGVMDFEEFEVLDDSLNPTD